MKKFCPNCGHLVSPKDDFCPNCGLKLKHQLLVKKTQSTSIRPTRKSFRKKPQRLSKKAKVILSVITSIILILIGFYLVGNNYYNNSQSKRIVNARNERTTKHTKNKISHSAPRVHLSSQNLTPKQTASVVLTYAGKKYPNEWNNAFNNAQNNQWAIVLKNQNSYPYMKQGSGVAYLLSDNLGYTLKQAGNDTEFYLFANKHQIGSVTLKQMVNYVNYHIDEKAFNTLSQNAKLDDELNNSGNTQTANSNTKLAGDAGLFTMPTAMQGTWYSEGYGTGKSTLNISDHKISDNDSNQDTVILHKMNSSFMNKLQPDKISKSYRKATQNWNRASIFKGDGKITWVNTQGWLQGAGDGVFYGAHTEKGQPVLVVAEGAEQWTNAVYWKTPALAKQYKNIKFKDLHWQN